VTRSRAALLAFGPVLLHALAREADRGLGLVLRAEIEPRGLASEVGRAAAADGAAAAGRVVLWLAGGLASWLLLAGWRRHREGGTWPAALAGEAGVFLPLLLRPAMTLLALVSVALAPSYPYGFTLPVALTQDWGIGQDAAALAALLALRLPRLRLPAPRAAEVFVLSFLAYAVLVPDWAWRWDGHPGNEPKYLRQAVALGHWLTFDAEGVSAAMEELPTRPLGQSLPAAAITLGRESWAMAAALARGEAGRDAIRATRIVRQTVRGKDGGVYYVLAPGPSLMLAPTLRLDRAINLARGDAGRVAVSVLAWCVLAALLVTVLFQLVRDTTGRPGVAAALAFGFAVVPPFLFYSFQFYPEMVGALIMAVAFRTLALRPEGLRRHPWLFGPMLAALPWLHQKFLPVWLVLVATALLLGPSSRGAPFPPRAEGSAIPADPSGPGRRGSLGMTGWAAGLVVPTLASLYLTALYNFAITGSVRPDALFLAWGPGGVTSARVGQGVLGLLLDARYGILPYVPILMLVAGGLALGGARRFRVVMPAAAVYYLTVASADNWAGAVCNLGRYFMPVAPLAVALVGIAIGRPSSRVTTGGTPVGLGRGLSSRGALSELRDEGSADVSAGVGRSLGTGRTGVPRDDSRRRGALAFVLMLAAWTGVFAVALRQDPHAASDSALLLAKSAYADGNQYLPNLFIRHWSDGAPGLGARVLVWLAILGAIAGWLRRAAVSARPGREPRGRSPVAVLATVAALVLALGLFLERWPGRRAAPAFPGAMAIAAASAPTSAATAGAPALLFLSGAASVREDEAVLGPGAVELLVRASSPLPKLLVTVGGQASLLRAAGLSPLVLRPTGALVDLPLTAYHEVRGRDGRSVAFGRTRLAVEGEVILRIGEGPVSTPDDAAPVAPEREMEPEPAGDR
jgi:hypothetical protein